MRTQTTAKNLDKDGNFKDITVLEGNGTKTYSIDEWNKSVQAKFEEKEKTEKEK